MFPTMQRFLSLTILTFLKVTISLTRGAYSMIINVCCTIESILRADTELSDYGEIYKINNVYKSTDNTIEDGNVYNSSLSAFTQTDEPCMLSTNGRCRRKSSTDIHIYNMKKSKTITITHTDLNAVNKTSNSPQKCEICKANTNHLLPTKETLINADATYDLNQSSLSLNSNNTPSSKDNYMSIENDVSSCEISKSTTHTKHSHGKSPKYFIGQNLERGRETEIDYIDNEYEDSDYSEETKQPEIIHRMNNHKVSYPLPLKTSSPVNTSERSFINPNNQKDISSNKTRRCNCREATKCIVSNSYTYCSTSDEDVIEMESNVKDSTHLFDSNVKQRFSLSPNFKSRAAKSAALELKRIEDTIEEEINATVRHNKSYKEIKFPFSPEINSAMGSEGEDDFKGMFSCSSYESLPVSDHVRNVIKRSSLPLYQNSYVNCSELNFSSGDDLVEAFQMYEDSVSITKAVKIDAAATSQKDKQKIKSIDRRNSCNIIRKGDKELSGQYSPQQISEEKASYSDESVNCQNCSLCSTPTSYSGLMSKDNSKVNTSGSVKGLYILSPNSKSRPKSDSHCEDLSMNSKEDNLFTRNNKKNKTDENATVCKTASPLSSSHSKEAKDRCQNTQSNTKADGINKKKKVCHNKIKLSSRKSSRSPDIETNRRMQTENMKNLINIDNASTHKHALYNTEDQRKSSTSPRLGFPEVSGADKTEDLGCQIEANEEISLNEQNSNVFNSDYENKVSKNLDKDEHQEYKFDIYYGNVSDGLNLDDKENVDILNRQFMRDIVREVGNRLIHTDKKDKLKRNQENLYLESSANIKIYPCSNKTTYMEKLIPFEETTCRNDYLNPNYSEENASTGDISSDSSFATVKDLTILEVQNVELKNM